MTSGRHHDTSHEEWDELAVGYALSALEPDELDRFVNHLVHFCPECAQSVADTDAVGAGLAAALDVADVPVPGADLRAGVLAAAFAARPPVPQTTADVPVVDGAVDGVAGVRTDDEREERDELARRRKRRVSPARLGWVAAAAAAVVAIVMSITTAVAVHSRNEQSALARHQADVISAFTTGGSSRVVQLRADGGAKMAQVVAHDNRIVVVPDAMDPNSAATTYVLWGLASSTSTPVALGVFDVTAAGSPTTVGSDARGYGEFSVFAISHEPGHTAPVAPSNVLAIGQA